MAQRSNPQKLIHVAFALVWHAKRILITRRPEGTHLAGFWEFPGGKINHPESPEECVVREVREEVGLTIRVLRPRPPFEYRYPDRTIFFYPIDCSWVKGPTHLLGVSELRWVPPNTLSEFPFPPANQALVAKLIAEGPFSVGDQ